MPFSPRHFFWTLSAGIILAQPFVVARADDSPAPTVQELTEQNKKLQQRVDDQQRQIDELRTRLDGLQPKSSAPAAPRPPEPEPAPSPLHPVSDAGRQIRLSGEAGLAFFNSGSDGAYPNSEFRVDDAKLFVEAEVWTNVYFYGGIDLSTREANDEYFHVGELYVDFERALNFGKDASLTFRAGRFYIPFGEEYQVRGVVDNPLISHSVTDLWGIDEGIEVYGSAGKFSYNLAVQNGGHKTMHDFDSDKSLTARIGFDATSKLHFSASAMRTGDLNVAGDAMSEMWLSNGFFRALGSPTTTKTFWADLAEVDASWRWKSGHLKANAGWIDFDDDSTAADYTRHMHYYGIEAVQQIGGNFYGAARYSRIDAPKGYPLVGQGNAGEYFYSPFAPFTTELERFTFGIGYRFGPPLVWKLDYSWEDGRTTTGEKRDEENLFSTEIALKF